MTIIHIAPEGDDLGRQKRSLLDWLRRQPGVREHAEISLRAAGPAEPGTMGVPGDVIRLVVDYGFQLGNLGVAVAAWRAACAPRARVTIEREGLTVTVSTADPATARALVRALGDERDRNAGRGDAA
ncbi:effector-associated constant component EACC1 [Streptomyces hainanensis]|uniref:Uncharacterized protein n=1 Tax=Streptomyces hainanensis TaxID=402648 RepID=A0A4R4T6Z6_9ACTN|nr:hypothetical protein [Streptomyces hainanensis]TDC72891.1 hypothetical protein E1283_20565 [Streptomyces hainanensis]